MIYYHKTDNNASFDFRRFLLSKPSTYVFHNDTKAITLILGIQISALALSIKHMAFLQALSHFLLCEENPTGW